jgi:PAS domain S-box-containing protein
VSSPPPTADFFERAPCGFLSTTPDGQIVRVNQTLLSWLGMQREEVVGCKRFLELLSVAGRIFHETHIAPMLHMQGSVRELALELVSSDGRRIPVLVSAEVHPSEVHFSIFDATERRRYERELLAARRRAEHVARAKADFLAMVSHEIRTPLNAIVSVAHLLERTSTTDTQHKYVRILRSSSSSLLALVNDILDFSKIEAGKMTLDERSFSLRELVEQTVLGQQSRANERHDVLRAELDPRLPPFLLGDPVKIGQILANLVGNAVKFTSGGQIVVAASVLDLTGADARVGVAVRDTGVGIPADQLATIFEEFEQAGPETASRFGGTGLGLAISRRLVELHGGRLEVQSEVGVGSTFSFELRLPLGQPTALATARAQADVGQPLAGLRALVAEDNEVNIFVLGRFLELWGVQHEFVRDGRSAAERARQGEFDFVLLDLRMPEMDGFEAAAALREAQASARHRPAVIAMSASMRSGQDEVLAKAGFDDFVAKPFDPEQLFRKIALHTGRHLALSTEGPPALTSWRGPEQLAVRPDFELEGLRASVAEASVPELFAATVRELVHTRAMVHEQALTGDQPALRATLHRVRPTLELLEAHTLWAALRRVSRLLEAGAPPEHLRAALLTMDWELDDLLTALRPPAQGA